MPTTKRSVAALLTAVLFAASLSWLSDKDSPVHEPDVIHGDLADSSSPGKPRSFSHDSADVKAAPSHTIQFDNAVRDSTTTQRTRDSTLVWGTVETPLGDVVEGETVELYSSSLNERYASTTNANGTFTIDGVLHAVDYTLSVRPDGMFKRYERSDLEIGGGQKAMRIILEPLRVGTLEGRIVDLHGRPVPQYAVLLRNLSTDTGIRRVRSDSVGSFQLADFPEGPFEVVAHESILRIDGLDFDPGSGSITTLVVDEGPHRLTGRVLDNHGHAREGVTVLLTWKHSRGGVRTVMERRTLSDTVGSFTFNGLGKGPHELVLATLHGAGLRRSVNIGADSGELIVYLEE